MEACTITLGKATFCNTILRCPPVWLWWLSMAAQLRANHHYSVSHWRENPRKCEKINFYVSITMSVSYSYGIPSRWMHFLTVSRKPSGACSQIYVLCRKNLTARKMQKNSGEIIPRFYHLFSIITTHNIYLQVNLGIKYSS